MSIHLSVIAATQVRKVKVRLKKKEGHTMKHDYSLENEIFYGGTQYIEEITTDLNTIHITFTDLSGKYKKILEVVGFYNFNISIDSPEDLVVNRDDYTLHLLIGFSFEKSDDGYLYCMKTNDHEMLFKSKNFPVIRRNEV